MRVRVKQDLDGQALARLGYKLVIIEGGYVSKDGATIVHLFRKPYNGEVSKYRTGAEVAHEKNVQELRDAGYLEEK